MTFLVSSSPLISGAFAVRAYPGFGILGADIPEDGDNGASPVLNDTGIVVDGEYYWRRETSPSAGTLTLYPDLTFEFDAPDGAYSWTYRVGDKSGLSASVGTVSITVGTSDGVAAGSLSGVLAIAPSASALGTSVADGFGSGLLPAVFATSPTASAIGAAVTHGSAVGTLPSVVFSSLSASAYGTAYGDGLAVGPLPIVYISSIGAVGGFGFYSLPSGGGYSRKSANTTRAKQTNTTRPINVH